MSGAHHHDAWPGAAPADPGAASPPASSPDAGPEHPPGRHGHPGDPPDAGEHDRHDDGHRRDRGHDHDHRHGRGHGDGHGHDHRARHGHPDDADPPARRLAALRDLDALTHRIRHLVTPHPHDTTDKVDEAMEASREGIRALWVSLLVLGATAALQALVVAFSGSVALLGDTLHNVADALTAVPLGIAFLLGRRAATRRYTYGYGRAEDLAGIAIVLVIAASSALAGYAAVRRLVRPADVGHLGYVVVAALLGFAGNEIVARYRIGVGRRIGSAALVADGLHARTDGFTSLAVLLGAGGVALGWRWADAVVGLVITVAILLVLLDAAREVYRRLMDAVDPALVDAVERVLRDTPGVAGVGTVQVRWIGHHLRAECEIEVSADLSVVAAHDIAVAAEHRLLHAVPRLARALVHADPQPAAGADHHASLAHHRDREGSSAPSGG